MPRDSHQTKSKGDDRARLPAHIVILIAGVMLLFVGGGAGLVYSSIANHTAPLQNTPTTHASPTLQVSPTAQATPTLQASPTISTVQNPYPPHTGSLAFNDPLKDNSKGYRWDVGIFGNGRSCFFTGKTSNVLQRGTSPAIKRGLNQPNLLAVVAQGSSIDLYVNGQSILHISNGATSNGLIGVAADATDQPAEVAFTNARVWML